MIAVELESSAYGAEALTRGLVVRLSRGTLFVLLFVIYIGALPLFISFSPALLYGTYVVYGLCAVGFLSFEWKASRNFENSVLSELLGFGGAMMRSHMLHFRQMQPFLHGSGLKSRLLALG